MKQACQYMDRLHALKDGELSNDEKTLLINHLQTCEACRAEWAALSCLSRLMGDIDEVVPSPDFDRTFWAKVEAYERKKPVRLFEWLLTWKTQRLVIPVVAVFIACAGLYLSLRTVSPSMDEMVLSDQIDFFEDFDVVNNLDLLENWDAINRMKVKT